MLTQFSRICWISPYLNKKSGSKSQGMPDFSKKLRAAVACPKTLSSWPLFVPEKNYPCKVERLGHEDFAVLGQFCTKTIT